MSDSSAPRWIEHILEALGADADFRDAVIGDLAEEYGLRVRWDGPAAARRWYYQESVRLAPYLVHDWWRGLRPKDGGYFASVIVRASMCMLALEWLLKLTVPGIEGALGAVAVGPAIPLIWTLVDGAFAGYVAAWLGRRAPLASALSLGFVWIVLMIVMQGRFVPLWFRAANTAAMAGGMFIGGVIRVCRKNPHSVPLSAG